MKMFMQAIFDLNFDLKIWITHSHVVLMFIDTFLIFLYAWAVSFEPVNSLEAQVARSLAYFKVSELFIFSFFLATSALYPMEDEEKKDLLHTSDSLLNTVVLCTYCGLCISLSMCLLHTYGMELQLPEHSASGQFHSHLRILN